jgi:Zn-dependent peptidase ImmA (M78 family)
MWTRGEIELKARTLLSDIEKGAAAIWPNTPPDRLFMCEPEAACKLLGLSYVPDQHLGIYGGTATAGMLDRSRRAILLSSKQSFEEMRFTAAHELGHWLLHPDQVMFRDRSPSTYKNEFRPAVEREADQFAAVFLMPPKLVGAAFRGRFPVTSRCSARAEA